MRSSSLVLLRHGEISVVTVMVEYQGPPSPFALVLPVPGDVSLARLKTVRRGTLSRVEQITAPRFHAFYEQDPCNGTDPEQSWDERIKARGPGFLASPGLPPLDRHYAVSNDISVPVEPVFKDKESEFGYGELGGKEPAALGAELAKRGYVAKGPALAALAEARRSGMKLLLAEVSLSKVELAGSDRVQLGGIRYVTHEPFSTFLESVGASNGGATEDVLVYVLDRKQRYALKDGENAFPPLSVHVKPAAAERLASTYAALFDAFVARHPRAFVTEFVWPTSGCGEPCPDVPLAPDELLTLGGDVLEAETVSAAEKHPEPSDESVLERERFESHLAELAPKERAAAEREHRADRKEIERRRALTARQTYVLTRLHHRYAASEPRRDLELAPAAGVTGGVGVPRGAKGELDAAARPADENRLQVRFLALEPWTRGVECSEPRRFRWGKRWASEARTPRAVPLALSLANARREPRLLRDALSRPLPELGITELPAGEPAPLARPATSPSASAGAAKTQAGCSSASGARSGGGLPWAGVLLLVCVSARRRWRRGG